VGKNGDDQRPILITSSLRNQKQILCPYNEVVIKGSKSDNTLHQTPTKISLIRTLLHSQAKPVNYFKWTVYNSLRKVRQCLRRKSIIS